MNERNRGSSNHPARTSRLIAAAAVVLAAMPAAAAGWEPDKAECIAPANPGGGWDTTCRSASTILQKTGLLKKNLYVTNVPGGSGAVAIAQVIARRKGDGTLIVSASNALTASMALKRTPSTYDDVIPLAIVGKEYSGVFVRSDSPFKTLGDLIAAMKKDPSSVSFAGGSAPGGQDHIKVGLIAKAVGLDPRKTTYVPFQGGGEAMTSLLGGHTKAAALDFAEAAAQWEAGALRCLAVLSDKRSERFKDVPTTHELGVKVSYQIWRGYYMAPGTPPEAVKFWSDTLKAMVATPEWAAERAKLSWEPAFMSGDEMKKFVKDEYARYVDLVKELGFVK